MAILLQQTEQGINRDVTGKHSGNLRSGTGNFKDNSIRFKWDRRCWFHSCILCV